MNKISKRSGRIKGPFSSFADRKLSKRAAMFDVPGKLLNDIVSWVLDVSGTAIHPDNPPSHYFEFDITDTKLHDRLVNESPDAFRAASDDFAEIEVMLPLIRNPKANAGWNSEDRQIKLFGFRNDIARTPRKSIEVAVEHELVHAMQLLISIYKNNKGNLAESEYGISAGLPGKFRDDRLVLYDVDKYPSNEKEQKTMDSDYIKHTLSDIEFYSVVSDEKNALVAAINQYMDGRAVVPMWMKKQMSLGPEYATKLRRTMLGYMTDKQKADLLRKWFGGYTKNNKRAKIFYDFDKEKYNKYIKLLYIKSRDMFY